MNNLMSQQNVLGDLDALDRIERFANLMASARVSVPKELQNNPGDCLAISLQAAAWQMNPFAVAQKSHVIKGKIGYEAQLVNAVVTRWAPITGRPTFTYSEGWEKVLGKFKTVQGERGPYNQPAWKPEDEKGLWCEVSATMEGEEHPRVTRMMLVQAHPRQSTQWATDPKQQLSYAVMKRWARLHCPDVLLGIYTPEELDQRTTTERDITPLKDRLRESQGEPLTVRKESDQPSARTADNPPEGEELAGTESTHKDYTQENTAGIKDTHETGRTNRIRKKLREQKQVPLPEPDDDDRNTLSMALDSINSCQDIKQLEQCGNDLIGMLHPELSDEARALFKARMDQLS